MKKNVIISLLFFGIIIAGDLKVGDKVKNFEAKTNEGKIWKSADYSGKKFIVVYFYPAAMTGGCTKQACSFRDDKTEFEKAGVEVVGISGDDVPSLKIFQNVHNLNFTLLSDEKGEIAAIFGVPVKEGGVIKQTVEGKEVELKRGVTTPRWTFIIDKKGNVVYKNTEVKAAEDSKTVLAFIKSLK